MQSTALDTSQKSKSMQRVTRMMDCIEAVQSFHSVLHFAVWGRKGGKGGGGSRENLLACQLVFDSIQNHI